jgi:hypothetical protein
MSTVSRIYQLDRTITTLNVIIYESFYRDEKARILIEIGCTNTKFDAMYGGDKYEEEHYLFTEKRRTTAKLTDFIMGENIANINLKFCLNFDGIRSDVYLSRTEDGMELQV